MQDPSAASKCDARHGRYSSGVSVHPLMTSAPSRYPFDVGLVLRSTTRRQASNEVRGFAPPTIACWNVSAQRYFLPLAHSRDPGDWPGKIARTLGNEGLKGVRAPLSGADLPSNGRKKADICAFGLGAAARLLYIPLAENLQATVHPSIAGNIWRPRKQQPRRPRTKR